MKKFFILLSLFFALCSISFFGCKNFMESEDFLTQLNDAVKYSNAPYAHVEIKADSHAILSIKPAVGEYNSHFKAGDKITLKFEEQEAYNFVEWVATPENAVIFDDAKERSTKDTVVSAAEPIVIEAYTVLRDKLQVKFTWDQGSVSAPSSSSFYLDEEFSFRYNAITDYAFLCWEITDGKGKNRNDILELAENGIDVTAKVLKVNENITIKAVSSKRPKVVSNSPLYSLEGVYRDRRIVIMFDQKMDDSCIYYNSVEKNELEKKGYTVLEENGKYYGYEDDEGRIHFKNITIEERLTHEPYEKYYKSPYFKENDKTIIYLDTKTDNDAPPGGQDILIILNKDLCSEENKTSLSGEFSWVYCTNASVDDVGPTFDTFNVQFTENTLDTTEITEKNDYKNRKITGTNIKMKVGGDYFDKDSGPGAIKWRLYKLPSDVYCDKDEVLIKENPINYTKNGNRATVAADTVIDVNMSDYSEGLYKFDIVAYDTNEKINTFKKYYFVYDNVKPNKPTVYIGGFNLGIRLVFDAPNNSDIKEIVISENDNQTVPVTNNEHKTLKLTDSKLNGNEYNYKLKTIDYAGNESDVVSVSDYAGIQAGYYCYLINNQDIIFSQNIKNDGKDLVGIVISDSVDSKTNIETAKIMRITVDENKSVVYNHPNTAVYDGTYGAGVDNQTDHGEIFYQSIVNNNKLEDFPKIKHLYYDVNNENKNIITWYLPGLNELLPLNGYWSGPRGIINTSLSKIPSNIKHMGWLGDGMSEMVSCTFSNSNASTPNFSVAYFNKLDYGYFQLKSSPNHATNSLLMAQINPAY